MKKMFILFFSLATLNAAFAQQGNEYYGRGRYDRNVSYQDHRNDDVAYNRNPNTADYGRYGNQQNNRGYNDPRRQEEMDRVHHDYDRRIDDYRNDRSINVYERDRRIQETQRERNNQLKSLGTGVLIGGILGVLIGSHL